MADPSVETASPILPEAEAEEEPSSIVVIDSQYEENALSTSQPEIIETEEIQSIPEDTQKNQAEEIAQEASAPKE